MQSPHSSNTSCFRFRMQCMLIWYRHALNLRLLQDFSREKNVEFSGRLEVRGASSAPLLWSGETNLRPCTFCNWICLKNSELCDEESCLVLFYGIFGACAKTGSYLLCFRVWAKVALMLDLISVRTYFKI